MALVIIFSVIALIQGLAIGFVERARANWFNLVTVWSLPILKGLGVFSVLNEISWWFVFLPLILALIGIVVGTFIFIILKRS